MKKDERSNSYIENYNRIIKLKLSNYLYGKNHCRISWPLFIYFIKNEEEEYKHLYNDLENEIVIKKLPDLENKSDKNKTFNNKKNEDNLNKKNIIVETKNHESKNNNLKWFKWTSDSCRYDSFSLLYSFIIFKNISKINRTPDIDIIDNFQTLSSLALNSNIDIYERGIWEFLRNNKNKYYDLCTEILNYKKMGTVFSILDKLKFQDIFCVKYTLHERYTKCNFKNESKNYLKPYYFINEEDINNKLSLEYAMIRLLSND